MRWWKIIGLAAFTGVAATGVVIVRAERRRRAYTPDEIRTRLRDRLAEASAADPAGDGPMLLPPPPETLPARLRRALASARARLTGAVPAPDGDASTAPGHSPAASLLDRARSAARHWWRGTSGRPDAPPPLSPEK